MAALRISLRSSRKFPSSLSFSSSVISVPRGRIRQSLSVPLQQGCAKSAEPSHCLESIFPVQSQTARAYSSCKGVLSPNENNENSDGSPSSSLSNLFHSEDQAPFCPINGTAHSDPGYAVDHQDDPPSLPGQRAFVECDRAALIDLFTTHAQDCSVSGKHLDREGLAKIMKAVGENADEETIERVFSAADVSGDGLIQLEVSEQKVTL